MGIQDELAAVKKPEKQKTKLDEWFEKITPSERDDFIAALKAPKEIFSHLSLVKIANNNGCDVTESTLRRYREKLQRETR
jgi:hypothetical protein